MGSIREATDTLRDQSATPQIVIGEMRWRARDVLPAFDKRDLAESLTAEQIGAIAIGEIAKAVPMTQLLPAYQGVKLADVAPLVDKEEWGRLQNVSTAVGEMAGVLGLEKGKDSATEVLAALKALHETSQANAKSARTQLITKVVGEMKVPQDLQALVIDQLEHKSDLEVTEDGVKKAVGEMKDTPTFKPLFARAGVSAIINPQSDNRGTTTGNGQGTSTTQAPAGLRRASRRLVG
jgi:hypothetical protein